MKRAAWLALFALVGACRTKDGSASPSADAGAVAPEGSIVAANVERAEELVTGACFACHSAEMLREQRLTEGQWEKVVKKMAGWGATLSADDLPAVSAYLATKYGPDAGPYAVATISAVEAANAIAPLDDRPFTQGSAEHGESLYAARCASCHGADARGQIGVNLVDRPLLYRAAEFARTIRDGRAKMPAQPLTSESDVADLLAHLRRLRVTH